MRKALKATLDGEGRKGVRLVETGCFSLCLARGRVLATTGQKRDRRLIVIQPGAAIEPALAYLQAP
ncbi:MAG: hypothetical protein ABI376_02160 [Caulobacteraceae bacterium]